MVIRNLNELDDETLKDWDRDGIMGARLADFSTLSDTCRTIAYFKNIESRLIEHIQGADIVFGCVAWLTNETILSALARVDTSIVVQKEDFLRPDLDASGAWPHRLRNLYSGLHCSLARYEMPGDIQRLSTGGSDQVDPVRCVGNHNASRTAVAPRSHHKFVVFGRVIDIPDGTSHPANGRVVPYGVWTGSYNFTKNAERSFENAVYMEDPAIVQAFVNEFVQVFTLSEPLNWESEWCAPEYRIGT